MVYIKEFASLIVFLWVPFHSSRADVEVLQIPKVRDDSSSSSGSSRSHEDTRGGWNVGLNLLTNTNLNNQSTDDTFVINVNVTNITAEVLNDTIPEELLYVSSYDPGSEYDGRSDESFEPMLRALLSKLSGKHVRKHQLVQTHHKNKTAQRDRHEQVSKESAHLYTAKTSQLDLPKVQVQIDSETFNFSESDPKDLKVAEDYLTKYIQNALTQPEGLRKALKNDSIVYKLKSFDSDAVSEEEFEEVELKKKPVKVKNVETISDNTDDEDDKFSESSSEEKKSKKKRKRYQIVPKHFSIKSPVAKHKGLEVVDSLNEDSLESTEESVPLSDETTKPPIKSKPRIQGKPETFMQSSGRIYKEGTDFRKNLELLKRLLSRRNRLPYFMPKRYHWDPAEFGKLGYFWFNGPQGKTPGLWKIYY